MATARIEPYLFFNGRCDEALEFYRAAVGAEVTFLMRYAESPLPPDTVPPGFADKVMHATIHIGGASLMLSDGNRLGAHFDGFSISLGLPTEADVDRAFAALSEGGQVTMPLARTFWSPRFGMLTDRFGVGWMLSVAD